MTAVPTLPQRTPGAALNDACGAVPGLSGSRARCEPGRPCDWHWARQHGGDQACGCCVGRYETCRNAANDRSQLEGKL